MRERRASPMPPYKRRRLDREAAQAFKVTVGGEVSEDRLRLVMQAQAQYAARLQRAA